MHRCEDANVGYGVGQQDAEVCKAPKYKLCCQVIALVSNNFPCYCCFLLEENGRLS